MRKRRKNPKPPLSHHLCSYCDLIVQVVEKGKVVKESPISETPYTVADFQKSGASHGVCRECAIAERKKFKKEYKARTKKNPTATEIDAAMALSEKFNGFEPSTATMQPVESLKIPTVLVELGELVELTYKSNKGDKRKRLYVHAFGANKPILAASGDGRLFILGGKFEITDRGIEG